MNQWLKNNKEFVLIIMTIASAAFTYIQHLDVQKQSLEFEKYKTITEALKQLSSGSTTIHQQTFFINELKNHPDYYGVSLRILKDVLTKEKRESLFTEEIERSIRYIKNEMQN